MATNGRFLKRQYTQYQYKKDVMIPSAPIGELFKAGTVVHDTDSDNLIFITTMGTQHPLSTGPVDTTAPSKTGESLGDLATAGATGTGSFTFDEAVTNVTGLKFLWYDGNDYVDSPDGSVAYVSGYGTTTINISYTAPSTGFETYQITGVAYDAVGNNAPFTSVDYFLF